MSIVNCPFCGKEIDSNSAYCTFCGHALPSNTITDPVLSKPQHSKPSTGNKHIILILSIVTLALALSNIVFIYLWQTEKKTPMTITSDTIASEADTTSEETNSIQIQDESDLERFYTVNKATGIYHYPECEDAGLILAKNKRTSITTRAELAKEGFNPCRKCIGDTSDTAYEAKEEKRYDYQSIELKEISDSKFQKVGYGKTQKVLLLQFRSSGEIYAYYDVPLNTFTNLVQSENIEDYWNKNVRIKYHSEKITY